MAEVVRQILLCLFLAALLGFAIGWLARGLRARRVAAAGAADLRRGLEEAQAELHALRLANSEEQRRVTGLQATADTARHEADALRRELGETERARDAARHDVSGTREQLMKLSAQLKDGETARLSALAAAETHRATVAQVEARVQEADRQLATQRRQLEQLQATQPSAATADATRQRLETLRATLQAAEAGWDSARAQAEAANQQLAATRRQLVDSEVDRQALAARLVEAQALLVELRSKLDSRPPTAPEAAPGKGAPAAEGGPASNARTAPVRDDLQQIRGIGPVLERRLHRSGVYRYAQIATWTREDILAMGERLPGFRDRIVRDRWTTEARRLHIAKYGSPP
ncbi:MAG: hypothetical protein ACLPJH_02805 [Myxococcaceae bacterium]